MRILEGPLQSNTGFLHYGLKGHNITHLVFAHFRSAFNPRLNNISSQLQCLLRDQREGLVYLSTRAHFGALSKLLPLLYQSSSDDGFLKEVRMGFSEL